LFDENNRQIIITQKMKFGMEEIISVIKY